MSQIQYDVYGFLTGVLLTTLYFVMPSETKEMLSLLIIEKTALLHYKIHRVLTHKKEHNPDKPISLTSIKLSITFYIGGSMMLIGAICHTFTQWNNAGLEWLVTYLVLIVMGYAFILLSQITLLISVWKLHKHMIEEY